METPAPPVFLAAAPGPTNCRQEEETSRRDREELTPPRRDQGLNEPEYSSPFSRRAGARPTQIARTVDSRAAGKLCATNDPSANERQRRFRLHE